MDDRNRPMYRAFGWAFVTIGGVFALVALAEVLLRFSYFNGNALPTALFVIFIGAALLYTVRERPEED